MTLDAATCVPPPRNEPVHTYAPRSTERESLTAELDRLQSAGPVDLPMTIGGERRRGSGAPIDVVAPHRHKQVLGRITDATAGEVAAAVAAALDAQRGWRDLPFDERAGVLLKAADLLAGPWRDRMNAATMLGQSKTCYQSEIDAACELADFWRFNVHFARGLIADQPQSPPGAWNRTDHRPLEGFVLAITPFNFTSIAGNLPTAPALMGNPVVWKPSPTQSLSAQVIIEILEAAGLPPGVINVVTGHGAAVSERAVPHEWLSGIHFTGSTATFHHLWRAVGERIASYRSYPRLVGETGGKDFVIAHPSADVDELRTGLIRGAFEYQGQKCSAASRAYIPRSIWPRLRTGLIEQTEALPIGDVTDFGNFAGAVIDRRSFDRLSGVIERARSDSALEIVAGGQTDDSEGFFVRPTIVTGTDPEHQIFTTEYFGPVLGVFVYDDSAWESVVRQAADVAPYALTGAVFARDRAAILDAQRWLRFSAGNFYVNDKPTGAVVGQQPFGGGRASGTNDKAGSAHNLLRWTSPRVIKETFAPATDWRYPHMG